MKRFNFKDLKGHFGELPRFIRNFFGNRSIRTKLFIVLLVTALVPLAADGYLSYLTSRKAITSKISRYSLDLLTQTALNLETKLGAYENISLQAKVNQEVNNLFNDYITESDPGKLPEKEQMVANYLNGLVLSDSNIAAIYFIGTENHEKMYFRRGLTMQEEWDQVLTEYAAEFRKTELYEQVMEDWMRDAHWSSAVLKKGDAAENMVVVARTITYLGNNVAIGVLVTLIKESSLDGVLNYNLYLRKSDLNKNDANYSIVVDREGKIISSPFKQEIGENIKSIISSSGELQGVLEGKSKEGNFLTTLKGRNVMLSYGYLPERGMCLMSFVSSGFLFAEVNAAGWMTILLMICGAILAVIISVYFILSIAGPLTQVVNAMKEAENGDFTVRVSINTRDELGRLGASFNHMIEHISELIKETKLAIGSVLNRSLKLEQSSEQSASTAESVAAAMSQISSGTFEQTNEAEGSVLHMTQLASEIEEMVAAAGEVESITYSTKETSFKSKDAVQLLLEKTSQTGKIANMIVKDIVELNASAEKIRGITGVIAGISEQTNLLALNAAIEAARAGETGLGFAVVAEEVNKLAAQSRDAARTIENILKNIQTQTETSKASADQAHQIVEEQKEAVEAAKQSFEEIIASMDSVVNRMEAMGEKIRRINGLKNQTVQSITNISTISEETAASAQEVSASSQEQTAIAEQVKILASGLKEQAESLVEIVRKFKIKELGP